MNNKDILVWIRRELGDVMRMALADSKTDLTEGLLAGLTCREVGVLIAKYAGKMPMKDIATLMRGDFTKRAKDKEATYHGYGFTQVDIDSFPEFVKSGAWKDPYKCFMKSIVILQAKRQYIKSKFPAATGATLYQAMIAAYNCGEGNMVKVLTGKQQMDSRTAGGDYSKSVLQFMAAYDSLGKEKAAYICSPFSFNPQSDKETLARSDQQPKL